MEAKKFHAFSFFKFSKKIEKKIENFLGSEMEQWIHTKYALNKDGLLVIVIHH